MQREDDTRPPEGPVSDADSETALTSNEALDTPSVEGSGPSENTSLQTAAQASGSEPSGPSSGPAPERIGAYREVLSDLGRDAEAAAALQRAGSLQDP